MNATLKFISCASDISTQALLKTPKWILPASLAVLSFSSLAAGSIIWALSKAPIAVSDMELSSLYVLIYLLSAAVVYVFVGCVVASGMSLVAVPFRAIYLGVKGTLKKIKAVSLSSDSPTIKDLPQRVAPERHNVQLPERAKTSHKPLPVSIPTNFKELFITAFTRMDPHTRACGYDSFLNALSSNKWTLTDLGRIARLLYDANVVNLKWRRSFKAWMIEFFSALGREDCPKDPEPRNYTLNEDSSVGKLFYDLVNRIDKTKS